MNTRTPIETSEPQVVLSVSWNCDCTCFSVGLNTGFAVFNSSTCALDKARDLKGGLGLVQMMGRTNFLALIGGGSRPRYPPNKVTLWDEKSAVEAAQISNMTPVRGIRLGCERVVVALQNSVRVYAFVKRLDLLGSYVTADNPLGLCDLSDRARLLAFPGRTPGQVQLVELAKQGGGNNVSIIPAHSAPLVAVRFSQDGRLLATASEKGTIIRVFATANCARVAELRRGWDAATVFSLGFSPSGAMLACTSDKGTLHIYDLPQPGQTGGGGSAGPANPRSPTSGPGASIASLASGGVAEGSGSGAPEGGDGAPNKGKWGILGKLPLMPRYFSDVVSSAQAEFFADDDPAAGERTGPIISGRPRGGAPPAASDLSSSGASSSTSYTAGGTVGGVIGGAARPPKGVIGWYTEEILLVVGGGREPRVEKFIVSWGQDGRRTCVREGWRRYTRDL